MASTESPVERKVQLTGGSTYTVSLPKDWAGHHDIEAGSTVRLYTRGDRLLITSRERDGSERSTTIEAANRDPTDLARCVSAAYVAGCEEVRVEGRPDTEQRMAIRDAVGGLVGIEVTAETETDLVARTMLDVGDLSPEQTLVQIELTALSMHESAIDALLACDDETARRIVDQDDDVDRLFGLVCREFQRSLVDVEVAQATDGLTTFEYYTAARQLERVADHAVKIAEAAERADVRPPDDVAAELRALGERSREIVERGRAGLLDGADPEALGAIVADADDVLTAAAELDRTVYERGLEDGYLLGTAVDSVVRTTNYGVNLAEAGLQAVMRTPAGTGDEV